MTNECGTTVTPETIPDPQFVNEVFESWPYVLLNEDLQIDCSDSMSMRVLKLLDANIQRLSVGPIPGPSDLSRLPRIQAIRTLRQIKYFVSRHMGKVHQFENWREKWRLEQKPKATEEVVVNESVSPQ